MADTDVLTHVTITVPFPDGGTLVACTCGHKQDCVHDAAANARVRHAITHAAWNNRRRRRLSRHPRQHPPAPEENCDSPL